MVMTLNNEKHRYGDDGLLPSKLFLSFFCGCIHSCSISRPSWTQFVWYFLKNTDTRLYTRLIRYELKWRELPFQMLSQRRKPSQAPMFPSQLPSCKHDNLKIYKQHNHLIILSTFIKLSFYHYIYILEKYLKIQVLRSSAVQQHDHQPSP